MAVAVVDPSGPVRMSLVRSIRVNAPPRVVAELLSRYDLLPLYERKVRRSIVYAREDGKSEVAVSGRFGLVPWSGRLLFTPRPKGGFDSVLLSSSALVGFSGSFGVRPDREGCVVTHVERYDFRFGAFGPLLAAIVRPLFALSLAREMRRLRALAESRVRP